MVNTHEKLISAAKELFEKSGFAAVTTKEISDLAGVSEVTLFRHFKTKRRLFDETVHSCIHPYTVDEFLKNEATYDLENDLKRIAYDMMNTYQQNAPLLRMIMRDKTRGSVPEMNIKKNEHCAENNLLEYFKTMKKLGKLNAEPKLAIKFFITNVTGYFMKGFLSKENSKEDDQYFAWMLEKVISILKA